MQGADSALDKDYQALFGLPVGVESVVMLPLNCLHLYKNDPFKDRSGEETENSRPVSGKTDCIIPSLCDLSNQQGSMRFLLADAGKAR
jgi:hypothetical protein